MWGERVIFLVIACAASAALWQQVQGKREALADLRQEQLARTVAQEQAEEAARIAQRLADQLARLDAVPDADLPPDLICILEGTCAQ